MNSKFGQILGKVKNFTTLQKSKFNIPKLEILNKNTTYFGQKNVNNIGFGTKRNDFAINEK